MFNKFMNWLVPKLEDWCVARGKVYNIMGRPGTPESESVYLIRHFLFRSKYFSIYLHRFMRSDVDVHHDHPFDFLGYIVKGGYTESMLNWANQGDKVALLLNKTTLKRGQGTWAFRRYKATHMVFLDRHYTAEEKKAAPCTVIFRGPNIKDWAFYVPRTPQWVAADQPGTVYDRVPWQKYLGTEKKDFE